MKMTEEELIRQHESEKVKIIFILLAMMLLAVCFIAQFFGEEDLIDNKRMSSEVSKFLSLKDDGAIETPYIGLKNIKSVMIKCRFDRVSGSAVLLDGKKINLSSQSNLENAVDHCHLTSYEIKLDRNGQFKVNDEAEPSWSFSATDEFYQLNDYGDELTMAIVNKLTSMIDATNHAISAEAVYADKMKKRQEGWGQQP